VPPAGGTEEWHRDGILDRGRSRHRRHGERAGAESNRSRHKAARYVCRLKQRLRHRREHEECDEEADASIGHECTGKHHREDCAALPKLFCYELRNRRDRAAVFHQFAEQRAEQKQWKELRQEMRRAAHKGLGPMGKQRFPGRCRGDQSGRRREQQDAPASIGQGDQEQESDQDSKQAHRFSFRYRGRNSGGWTAE